MDESNYLNWEPVNSIYKRIKSFKEGYRQNIAILDTDRDRISYLLDKYLAPIKEEGTIFIYLDTTYAGSEEIFKNISYALLGEYLNVDKNLDTLINLATDIIPVTTGYIKKVLREKNSIPFLHSLELINKFIKETSRKCILIINEFTRLKEIFLSITPDFPQFIIFQNECMVILVSSQQDEAERLLAEELNLLFGNFERIYLNTSGFLENYSILKTYLAPLNPSPFFLSFFVNILGTNRMYYDIVSKYALANHSEDESTTIINTLLNALFCRQSFLFQKFMKNIDYLKDKFKDFPVLLKIILHISRGYIRKKELLSLNICPSKSLNGKLQKLQDANMITPLGNIYRINDELFSFWLSHIFYLYFYPAIFNHNHREKIVKYNIQESISVFRNSFNEDKITRISDFISSFRNDLIKLNTSRLRLPRIERTKIIPYPEKKLNFLIAEGKEIIFVGIKEDYIDDIDVIEYLEKTSIFSGRNIKKIFITLDNFTSSAKLIGETNRLILWDGNTLNSLLRIYRKPVIIHEDTRNI